MDKILLQEIAKFVGRKDGFFILDEIYQGLVHENGSYSSGLEVSDDLFVINSFSKFFGMTGWRLGWVVMFRLQNTPRPLQASLGVGRIGTVGIRTGVVHLAQCRKQPRSRRV